MDSQDQTSNEDDDASEDAVGSFVIDAFEQYYEYQLGTNWSWIASAVMIGNYSKTGPLINGKTTKWKQTDVATACLGNVLDLPGYPDQSMTVTMVYSPTTVPQTFQGMRNAIKARAPVVFGWGATGRGGAIYNNHVIVVYGFDGPNNWYYGDPQRLSVSRAEPLPIPDPAKLQNPQRMIWYSRVPSINMR